MKFFIFVTVAFLASFIVQEFIPAFEWAYLSRLLLVHITFLAIAAAVPFPAMLLYALIGGFIWDARHHIPIYPPEATAEIFIQAELPFGFTIFIFGLTGALIQGVRPLFCKGIGPFRWCALSGDPEDIYKTDAKMKELFPENEHLHRWIDMAQERIAFQGLPARICWIGLGDRHRAGLAFNEMVANGELKAPVVIGRDHLDSGSVASPNRETEAMLDGSDAVSDWPLLNALINTASGATWVSLHHGGGVGMGFSQHAGVVICADGTEDAARRLERVLWNDPASGVWRHADAGYDIAKDCARAHGLRLPGILG